MPPDVASPRASAWGRFDAACARASERFDAVVVKDVRQALRSRFFVVTFVLALVFTSAGGLLVLAKYALNPDMVQFGGGPLYGVTAICASFGAVCLVPFAAFASMTAETDENTIDLVSLSRLTPVEIVRGKLVTACVQALLVYCVCLPYLCVAWALGKLDPMLVVSTFAELFAMSIAFSAVAIALASLARSRVLRGASVTALVAGAACVGWFAFEPFVFVNGRAPSGAIRVALLWAAGLACVVPLALAFAAEGVAHRETSTSTPLRLVASSIASAGTLFLAGWIALDGTNEAPYVFTIVLALLAAPLAWVVSERERLPASVRTFPPQGSEAPVFVIVQLSGGGRGALLATLAIGGVSAVYFAACFAFGGGPGDDAVQGLVLGAYTWIYLMLPSVCLARFDTPAITRVVIAVCPLLAVFVQQLAYRVLGDRPRVLDVLDPYEMAMNVTWRGGLSHAAPWIALGCVFVVTYVLNVPRMSRGVREVRQAQRARRSHAHVAVQA